MAARLHCRGSVSPFCDHCLITILTGGLLHYVAFLGFVIAVHLSLRHFPVFFAKLASPDVNIAVSAVSAVRQCRLRSHMHNYPAARRAVQVQNATCHCHPLQLIDDLSRRQTTTAASYAPARDYKVLDGRLFYSLQVQSRSDRLVKQQQFLLLFKEGKRASESSKAEAFNL